MSILSVKLVAKSKHGQGTVDLKVGQRIQDTARIYGNPRKFNRRGPRTFDRILLENRSGRSNGAWQLKLQGNIKVKKVVVTLKKKREQGHGRVVTQSFGTVKADKINTTKTFAIGRNLQSITIVCESKIIDISRVMVEYGNGQIEELTSLDGMIFKGMEKSARINGRNVIGIKVKAKSVNPFGGRAKYTVLASVYQ